MLRSADPVPIELTRAAELTAACVLRQLQQVPFQVPVLIASSLQFPGFQALEPVQQDKAWSF
jgi:hypothetical protein